MRLHDRVSALVAEAKRERRDAIHRRDRRVMGEDDARRGARELREDETGHERGDEEPGDRLDRDDDVRRRARWVHRAVADRTHRLDAEGERVGERAGARPRDAAEDEEEDGEARVQSGVRADEDRERHRPRDAEEEVVRVAERRSWRSDHADARRHRRLRRTHRARASCPFAREANVPRAHSWQSGEGAGYDAPSSEWASHGVSRAAPS